MEIVGVIAAVPPLLMMIKRTSVALGQISSKSRTSKVAHGVRTQLDLLSDMLTSIETRIGTTHSRGGSQEARLRPVLHELETEITQLLDLVDKAEGTKTRSTVFKRAHLVLSGFEKDLKERSQHLDRTVNFLQVRISEWTLRSTQRSQLRKALAASATTDFIPKKLDGTLEWIWHYEAFKAWAISSGGPLGKTPLADHVDSRVLIIHGVKGCGKSVLAASIVDTLKSQGSVALFFSFWASHDRERRIDSMFRALSWQLLESLPEETQVKFISLLLESRAQLANAAFLVEQLGEMAQALGSDVYCILDGIDESVDNWNSPQSESPLAHLEKLLRDVPQMRLLLVGRQSSLRSAIQRWPNHFELTRDLLLGDLEHFVSAEMDNCPNITDGVTREAVRRELDAKSTVMFLWIKLVFQQLRSSFSTTEVRYTLSRVPEELDREYSRLFSVLMSRLQGRPDNPSAGMTRAKGLLEIIVGASRPLSVLELRLAYAFSFLPEDSSTRYLESLVSEEGIIDACGDFITINDGLVCLGHTSMREFLLRPAGRWIDQDGAIAYFRLDSQRCHRVLATSCLRYLQYVDWEREDLATKQEKLPWADTISTQYPLASYASSFFTSHLLDSDLSPGEVTASAEVFVASGKFTPWLDFAAVAASEDSANAPPPLHFWEDVLNFWGALNPSGTIEHFLDADPGLIAQSNGALADVAGETALARRGDQTAAIIPTHTNNFPQALLKAFEKTGSKSKAAGIGQLVLRLPAVRSLIKRVDIFIDPLDMLIQAFERSLDSASFLHLMIFGFIIEKKRGSSDEAGRVYKKALSRVRGKGDLREAWALTKVANCGQDAETREAQYQEVMELLEQRRDNPLANLGWASASTRRADCLFDLDREDESKQVAADSEKALLDRPIAPGAPGPGSLIRKWCYGQLSRSSVFKRMRMSVILNLGDIYDYLDLEEDIERMLGPHVQDVMVNGHLSRPKVIRWIRLTASSRYMLHRDEEACLLYTEMKAFLRQSDGEERVTLASAQVAAAVCHASLGRYQEAINEIASTNIPVYLEEICQGDRSNGMLGRFTETFFAIHWWLGQSKDTAHAFATIHWPIIERAFTEDRMPPNDALIVIIRNLVCLGFYAAAESYLRQMLSPERLEASRSKLTNLFLLEALAFSTRQEGQATEACDLYLQSADLARVQVPKWNMTRLQYGFGLACLLAGRCREASEALYAVWFQLRSRCNRFCVADMFRSLVLALALWQGGAPSKAVLELRYLLSFPLQIQQCSCGRWLLVDESTIAVDGNMLAAHILDSCGRPSFESRPFRKRALKILHEDFSEALRKTPPAPKDATISAWHSTWARACRRYLAELEQRGTFDADKICPMFPHELSIERVDGAKGVEILTWNE